MIVCSDCQEELSMPQIIKQLNIPDIWSFYGSANAEMVDPAKYKYVTYKGEPLLCRPCRKLRKWKLLT